MVKFYTALSANIGGLMTCGDTDRVVSGEFAFFGLDCGDQEVRLRQRKGEPIATFYPKEGTAIYAFSPGIPLTAAHPNAARLFIAYLLTPPGQKLLWDEFGCDNYLLARLPHGADHRGGEEEGRQVHRHLRNRRPASRIGRLPAHDQHHREPVEIAEGLS